MCNFLSLNFTNCYSIWISQREKLIPSLLSITWILFNRLWRTGDCIHFCIRFYAQTSCYYQLIKQESWAVHNMLAFKVCVPRQWGRPVCRDGAWRGPVTGEGHLKLQTVSEKISSGSLHDKNINILNLTIKGYFLRLYLTRKCPLIVWLSLFCSRKHFQHQGHGQRLSGYLSLIAAWDELDCVSPNRHFARQ